jgi:hypothetical protein
VTDLADAVLPLPDDGRDERERLRSSRGLTLLEVSVVPAHLVWG